MEVHAADQYLVAPGEAGLLEVYGALEGTGLFPPFPPVELPGGVGGLVARGGFAQTFFFPAEVLGLTFRTPKGEVVRAGGLVVKNVQGYDLVRPFVGSFGLLGEALEVVFRLRPGRAFAFHYGHEKEVARFREAFLGEEVGPLDLRPLFPRGMGVGEGPLRDLRFAWKDGGEAPRPPEAFLRWVRGMGYPL